MLSMMYNRNPPSLVLSQPALPPSQRPVHPSHDKEHESYGERQPQYHLDQSQALRFRRTSVDGLRLPKEVVGVVKPLERL
jgi:hypothetical protein